MAKFCTKCGKPLKDGKPCDCQKDVKETEKKEEVVASVTAKNYLNLFLEIVKGIFIKPADTIKKYSVKENFIFALMAILLNSVITGVFVYFLLKEGSSIVASLMGYGSLFGASIDISFMKVLLQITLFMIVAFLVSALMIYVMAGALFKAKTDVKQCISLVGVCSIFTLITTIVVIVCTFISIKFALILLVIAGAFYLTHLYQGITDISGLDKNKYAYTFMVPIVVASFVVLYILPKLLF